MMNCKLTLDNTKTNIQGITLISLVVTIIILIILAGIVITLAINENGILNMAKKAKIETLKANAKEKLEIKASEVQIEKKGEATLKDFAEYLDRDSETYIISLTKTANVQGGIPKLENVSKIYVTYNNFEFEVDQYLKITYVGSNNIDSNENDAGNTGSSGGTSLGEGGENLYGCRRHIEVEVTDAIMGEMKLSVEIPNKDRVKAIEYYIDGKLIHSGLEKTYTVSGLQAEKEYKVSAIVEYEPEEIITTAKIQNIGIVSVNSEHTEETKDISWGLLERFAKIISDNEGTGEKQVDSDSAGVTIAVGKDTYTIGIGDIFMLDGKRVRLLGFNHDELTNKATYGGNNKYAGISFDYIDFITDEKERMNSEDTNVGGWKEAQLRTKLNGTNETIKGSKYEEVKEKINIKQVNKKYLKNHSDLSSIDISSDYLWLLSYSEIFGEVVKTSYGGSSPMVMEGEQYKYYKYKDVKNNEINTELYKYSGIYARPWWERSLTKLYSNMFCVINDKGQPTSISARTDYNVAPRILYLNREYRKYL